MSSSLRRQRFKDGRRHSLDKICLGTCIPALSQFLVGTCHARRAARPHGPCLRLIRRLLHHRPRLCRPSLANFHAHMTRTHPFLYIYIRHPKSKQLPTTFASTIPPLSCHCQGHDVERRSRAKEAKSLVSHAATTRC